VSKQDRDTRPIPKESVFKSVPVYIPECEFKRGFIWDAIRELRNRVFHSRFRRFLGRFLIAIIFILAVGATALGAYNYLKLSQLQHRVEMLKGKGNLSASDCTGGAQ